MKPNNPSTDYYAGHHRFVRDGIPCRMAPWVKDLTPFGRDSLLRGSEWGSDYHPGSRFSKAQRKELCSVRYEQTQYVLFEDVGAPPVDVLIAVVAIARFCIQQKSAQIISFRSRRREAAARSYVGLSA